MSELARVNELKQKDFFCWLPKGKRCVAYHAGRAGYQRRDSYRDD